MNQMSTLSLAYKDSERPILATPARLASRYMSNMALFKYIWSVGMCPQVGFGPGFWVTWRVTPENRRYILGHSEMVIARIMRGKKKKPLTEA